MADHFYLVLVHSRDGTFERLNEKPLVETDLDTLRPAIKHMLEEIDTGNNSKAVVIRDIDESEHAKAALKYGFEPLSKAIDLGRSFPSALAASLYLKSKSNIVGQKLSAVRKQVPPDIDGEVRGVVWRYKEDVN